MTPPSIALLFLAAALLGATAGTAEALTWPNFLGKNSPNNSTTTTTKAVDSTTVTPTTVKSKGLFGRVTKTGKTASTTTPKPPEVEPVKKEPMKADEKEKKQSSTEPTATEKQEPSQAVPIPIIFYSPEGYGDYNPLAPNSFQSPYGPYLPAPPPQPYNPYALWKMFPWAEQPLADLSASVPWSPPYQRQARSLYPSAPLYPPYPPSNYYYPPSPPHLNSPCSHSSHSSEHAKEEKHSQHHDHHHTTTTTEEPNDPSPTKISLSQPTQNEPISYDQNEGNMQYYPYSQIYDNYYYPQYAGYPQMFDYQQYAYNNYYQQSPPQVQETVKNKEKRHKRHHRHHSE